jgi:hypothetical protein
LNLTAETEQEPSPMPTYLIGPSSTIDPVPLCPSFTALPAPIWLVVLAILDAYLGIGTDRRNETPLHPFGIGPGI